jgi:hypothetical protein
MVDHESLASWLAEHKEYSWLALRCLMEILLRYCRSSGSKHSGRSCRGPAPRPSVRGRPTKRRTIKKRGRNKRLRSGKELGNSAVQMNLF